MYPIFHQPTFMKQYRLPWELATTDDPLNKTFPALANVIFALASLFAPGSS